MIYVVLGFLAISFVLYVLLAGADFGAGIIELFSSKKNQQLTKKTVYRVMGPVWEANHIWIILMIVIMWIAFPKYYNILVVYLHIPLTLVLLGITLRGVAFVFRHYDAFKDRSQLLYDWMFRISSLVTPIFLGLTFGACLQGEIIMGSNDVNYSFTELYISPWLNSFSLLVGVFFAALCAFLASILLIGESDRESRTIYVKKALIATITVVLIGFITLIIGYFSSSDFVNSFLSNVYAIGLAIASSVLLVPLWFAIRNGKRVLSRLFAGLQVLFVLFVPIIAHYPNILHTRSGELNILSEIASPSVVNVLGISLLIGGALILPGLFHLFKSFKMIKILER
ncbi:cytochrome d ubiquinol oxidase subunit II [Spongiivirga citrea]|uniref:Cytochrome d ubiquinol oxidase subunit II n=1 Tax=Spongiivirga citrea TaxID=1481457 RepID=A0A6M0CL21_9FLAO|nr:cytochrome d ubiquinol oxidase subunit II [Spongiivirga citrea]NER18655.1 cytochrome d ubiquinol oxidase subunit II [Spongiivirga citrea]